MTTTRAPSQARWQLAIALAVLTGAYAAARAWHEPAWPTDFDQIWFAARALLHGQDPYSVVGPGRAFQWNWPLYYPLPAVLLAVPFAWMPVVVARVAFSTVSAAVLGWALGPRLLSRWPMILSAAYIIATSRTQWALLLLAVTWAPVVGFVVTAKPNVGAAALAALDRRGLLIALAGCALLGVLSVAVRPDWIGHWREAIATSPHILSTVLLPGGFLLALAALRWRRPDARLLLALACVPHTPSLYDVLLLFFVCQTTREALVLALLTHSLYWGIVFFGSFPTFDLYAAGLGKAAVWLVYVPALVMVLKKPNDASIEGPAPRRWRDVLPMTHLDITLCAALVLAAIMLVWLPLATYR
ncbi:MAG: hypothetical protein U0163_05945 [Gemmatimonadaceae bacterium]